MDEEPKHDQTFEGRKSVRFSGATQEFFFEPDVSMKTEQSNTSISDENLFRVPQVLRGRNYLTEANVHQNSQTPSGAPEENVKMAISPGTKATESKKNAKLQRLLEMQLSRQRARARRDVHLPTTPKIDLSRTERTFIEGSSDSDTSKFPATQLPYTIPEPRFSDISCIHPSNTTFSVDQAKGPSSLVCSTPLRNPSPAMGVPAAMLKTSESDVSLTLPAAHIINSTIKEMVLASDEDYLMTKEERIQHQMKAMAVWCSMILRSQYEDDELDIGTTKQEANKVLQDLLAKSGTRKSSSAAENKPFRYADYLVKQKRDSIRESALRLFDSSKVPALIRNAVHNHIFSIRADCNVYSDLRLQTTLLRLFFSFHPAWLHLGLETVFKTEIKIGEGEVFAQVISRFIAQRLFSDPKILKNKKYVIGAAKLIVTDAGREALHSHFLLYACLFFYFVETAKAASVIKHNPRMFTRNSAFKSMGDVFAELSRELLSGSGTPLNKAFAKMGFKPSFKQGFADDYNYTVTDFSNLTDGIILGKIIELVTSCPPGSLISRLRNPGGDRLRKIGNVKVCIQVAAERGVDVGAIKADSIVATNKEAILEVLWKLVGVYVGAEEERNLRRASLALANQLGTNFGIGVVPEEANGEEIVLHVCKQIGHQLGIEIDSLNDLRDGRLFAGAWRLYNVSAPDIRLYPGETLLLKVASAAETDLGVPWGLHHSLGLFGHLYLSHLFSIRELHDAATRIQRAYRSYRLLKAIKEYLASAEGTAEKTRRATAGASQSMVDSCSFMATYTVIHEENSMLTDSSPIEESMHSEVAPQMFAGDVSASKGDQLRRALRELRAEIEAGKLRSIEDRDAQANEAIFIHLTVKLQALIRGFLARRRFRAMVDERKLEIEVERNAQSRAPKVEAQMSGVVERVSYKKLLEHIKTERIRNEAACKIQKAYRLYQLRKKKRTERHEMLTRIKRAATTIQSMFRMLQSKRKLEKLKQKKALEEKIKTERRIAAAIIIQSFVRMFIAKNFLKKLKMENDQLKKARENAAVLIQSLWRGWMARQQLQKMREERRLEQQLKQRELAVCRIQKAFRSYLLRQKMRAERQEKWSRIENAVIGIQKHIRGMLARKRFAEMLTERKKYVMNVVMVQSCVRAFLARCRARRMMAECENRQVENDAVFDDTRENTPSTSAETESKDDIDIERLRRLQRNVHENKRKQKYYSSLLEACERKLSEEDSSCTKGLTSENQQPADYTPVYVPTLADQVKAALKIQAWYRGCVVRSNLREHLHRRRSFMRAYLGNIAAEEPSDVVNNMELDALPVHAKIHDAIEMLFHSKMYISKVGAFIMNRLSALSPHLCAYLAVDAQGLVALLDIFGQKTTGRGPGTAEILTILADVFLRIIECQHPAVVAEVDAQLEDCVRTALHIFHAFHTYPQIVFVFGKAILALHRRPEANQFFNNAPFYLNYAKRRFARFPINDPRKVILEEMIAKMLPS
ncbi:hypothetical protein RB195_009475 [Necator americanus]|uniref:Calponin-homology (CH) domain-containing protein n=1 Tax=Necator americanus TaxID=51031 RepID=A0ABR1CTG8_NECAM